MKAEEPYTTVRIHQVNTDSIINAKVAVKDGRAVIEGDQHIDGVPTLGSTIELDFSDSVGGITGKLLPTGNVTDTITTTDGKTYEGVRGGRRHTHQCSSRPKAWACRAPRRPPKLRATRR